MNLTTFCPFFLSNCLTGKGWVTPLRALLSAIFCGVWGLRFLASLGKLCLKSMFVMWNTTGVPHCGSSFLFLSKMMRLVTNLLFCIPVSLFRPDKRQRWVMFRCSVRKLCPPELPLEDTVQWRVHGCAKIPKTWWENVRKAVVIKTTKVPSIRPGVRPQATCPRRTITSEPAPLISFIKLSLAKAHPSAKN